MDAQPIAFAETLFTEFFSQTLLVTDQNQRNIIDIPQRSPCCSHGHRRTEVSSHGVKSDNFFHVLVASKMNTGGSAARIPWNKPVVYSSSSKGLSATTLRPR